MTGRLEGKVAIVTGAASGIGRACVERYAREGATVVGTDLNPAEDWERVVEGAPASRFYQFDICDYDALSAVVSETVENFGRIDILVTAAGIAGGGPVHLVTPEDWDRVQNVNVKGTFLAAKAVLPTMMEQRSGSIIAIASIEGIEGTEGGSAYNASKGAVAVLAKNIAIDYGRLGIRSNAICPGMIETPLFETIFGTEHMAPYRERFREQHKLNRFGKPEEIAGAAYFLASEDSSFVTGQNIVVDGGFTAGHWVGITSLMGLE